MLQFSSALCAGWRFWALISFLFEASVFAFAGSPVRGLGGSGGEALEPSGAVAMGFKLGDGSATSGAAMGGGSGCKADTVTLSASDEGLGLPGASDVDKDSGLGMKIVRALVMQTRAKLTINRHQPGSEFVIEIPLQPEPPAQDP